MFKAFDNYINWLTKGFSHLVLGLFLPIIVVAVIIIGASPEKKKAVDAQAEGGDVAVVEKAPPDPHAIKHSDRNNACDAAKKFVKPQLKAPTTASFTKCDDVQMDRDGTYWHLRGYVDAENSFGAKLRNVYDVTMTAVKDGFILIAATVTSP